MIIVEDLHKRYKTEHGPGKWVLQGVNLTIPRNVNVGLIGANGAGKSTLLSIIGGIDHPNKGRVERRCRLSWPMGQGGLEPTLTGRQNAKFVCRVHGHQEDLADRLAFVLDFSELGEAFDEPVNTYSSGMRSRLQFALSLAFDFDTYISDEVTAAGDAAFRKKAAAAFQAMTNRAGLIMVAHDEGALKQFCQAGIFLYQAKALWFDDIGEAFKAYKDTMPT
ncbi:MAG: Polysialic acid transport ATP-binding protein KpsT [Candidatus Accumulibacter adjunctus]|uniref:Polysialic acid transport ATP-binding protein KpsT n=1 Tax=Candidatus Accumulibacter adjunctus TaxID=1454001 RepID=A0A011NVH8_9PROT|nr:MAG: Polysialic acid transport ATP-binding protein KpsT [Candidatus Accumulibacter adjunctus]